MVLGILILLIMGWYSAFANELSPVGLWKTIDDNTGKPRGLVRITEVTENIRARWRGFSLNLGKSQTPSAKNAMARAIINRLSE